MPRDDRNFGTDFIREVKVDSFFLSNLKLYIFIFVHIINLSKSLKYILALFYVLLSLPLQHEIDKE